LGMTRKATKTSIAGEKYHKGEAEGGGASKLRPIGSLVGGQHIKTSGLARGVHT